MIVLNFVHELSHTGSDQKDLLRTPDVSALDVHLVQVGAECVHVIMMETMGTGHTLHS